MMLYRLNTDFNFSDNNGNTYIDTDVRCTKNCCP